MLKALCLLLANMVCQPRFMVPDFIGLKLPKLAPATIMAKDNVSGELFHRNKKLGNAPSKALCRRCCPLRLISLSSLRLLGLLMLKLELMLRRLRPELFLSLLCMVESFILCLSTFILLCTFCTHMTTMSAFPALRAKPMLLRTSKVLILEVLTLGTPIPSFLMLPLLLPLRLGRLLPVLVLAKVCRVDATIKAGPAMPDCCWSRPLFYHFSEALEKLFLLTAALPFLGLFLFTLPLCSPWRRSSCPYQTSSKNYV